MAFAGSQCLLGSFSGIVLKTGASTALMRTAIEGGIPITFEEDEQRNAEAGSKVSQLMDQKGLTGEQAWVELSKQAWVELSSVRLQFK